MKETQIIGKLLPTHTDILPILEEILEKYGNREIRPEYEYILTKNYLLKVKLIGMLE